MALRALDPYLAAQRRRSVAAFRRLHPDASPRVELHAPRRFAALERHRGRAHSGMRNRAKARWLANVTYVTERRDVLNVNGYLEHQRPRYLRALRTELVVCEAMRDTRGILDALRALAGADNRGEPGPRWRPSGFTRGRRRHDPPAGDAAPAPTAPNAAAAPAARVGLKAPLWRR